MLLAAALALSLPLHFEPNLGHAPADAQYFATTPGYTLFLSDTAVKMRLRGGSDLTMRIPRAHLASEDALPGRTNYYPDAQAATGRSNIPNYARARYRNGFPGIDLVIYGTGQQVEYDWVVAPNGDPAAIHFSFTGYSAIRIDKAGDLILDTPSGVVRHRKPYIYQERAGKTSRIQGGFVLSRGGDVGFQVGNYDHRLPLIVDPTLVYAVGIGGSGIGVDLPQAHYQFNDTGTSMAVDANGNVYISGTTYSIDFPLVNALSQAPTSTCHYDCLFASLFVAKLSPDGSKLLYSTFIGSSASGSPYQPAPILPGGIALNPLTGHIYMTGGTAGKSGGMDAFVTELDANGALVASTQLGGSGDDAGNSIVLAPDGTLYIAGTTRSSNFPTTTVAYRKSATAAGSNIFLMKVASSNLAFEYSSYLGPGDTPALAVDTVGNAYIAGATTYPAWPTTNGAPQPQCSGTSCADIVLTKLNAAGTQLTFATYFGGSGVENIGGIALDSTGSVYLSGSTSSLDLPTTAGAFQPKAPIQPLGQKSAFAAKFDPSGKVSYSTYITGSGYEQAHAIAVDGAGNAYIGGETGSEDFPVASAIQVSLYHVICPLFTASGNTPYAYTYCSTAGFLTVLDSQGSGLVWSTYLGKGAARAITFDKAGNIYATGVDLAPWVTRTSPSKNPSASVLKIAPQTAGLGFTADSIVNGASFRPGLPGPGGLASLFVQGLDVTGTVVGTGIPLPTELAGVSILVQGVAAPILSVSNLPVASPAGLEQINFQVPFGYLNNANVVEVRYRGVSTFVIPTIVAPGIFLLGDGTPAIQHASDYSLVTSSHPAAPGEVIVVYLTGLGPVVTPVASGVPAGQSDAASSLPCSNTLVSAGTILYAGLTPGYIGLYQINVRLPDTMPLGVNRFYLNWGQCTVGGSLDQFVKSNVVDLPVGK